MIFKSEQQLKNFLLKKCQIAILEAEQKVYQIIDSCLDEFYGEFNPAEYIRTKQLFHSLVRTGVMQEGDTFIARVYFDASKLNYRKGKILLQSGSYGFATWTGEKVLDVAMTNDFPHGKYAGANGNTAIWTESMARLGDILVILEQELIAHGIPIKKT